MNVILWFEFICNGFVASTVELFSETLVDLLYVSKCCKKRVFGDNKVAHIERPLGLYDRDLSLKNYLLSSKALVKVFI